jgi:hypothetical protein
MKGGQGSGACGTAALAIPEHALRRTVERIGGMRGGAG